MKKRLTYFLMALGLFAAAACNRDNLMTMAVPAPEDSKEIHFLNTSLTKEFPKDAKETYIDVVVVRNDNQGERKIVLQLGGKDAGIFSLKDTLVIEDGAYSASVRVAVDMGRVIAGTSATASLYIIGRDVYLGEDTTYITQYSDKLTMTVSEKLEWEPLMRTTSTGEQVQQTASYNYAQFYEGTDSGLKVEKAIGVDGIFRLLDWAGGVPLVFKRNPDNTCVVPAQKIGYEDVMIADLAVYLADDSFYDSYPCTFDGDATYTFNVIYYTQEGFYGYGEETLVLDKEKDTTPVVTITEDELGTIKLTPNEFCDHFVAGVAMGDISKDPKAQEQLISAIPTGSAGYVGLQTFSNETEYKADFKEGVSTVFVLAYDSENIPVSKLAMHKVINDPDGKHKPSVTVTLNPLEEDPYSTFKWNIKTTNALEIKYFIYSKDFLDYLIENGVYTEQDIFDKFANTLSSEYTLQANSEEGLELFLIGREEGKTYKMMIAVSNDYGQTVYKNIECRAKSHADNFDQTKTIDDFTGMFICNATSYPSSSGNPVETSFRVDVIRESGNKLVMTGFCQEIDYSPSVVGFYDNDKHCVRISGQSLGRYDDYYMVSFGFAGDLYSAVWSPDASIEIGFNENGNLYMREGGEGKYGLDRYGFLLFNSDGSYARYTVGGVMYGGLQMQKLSVTKGAGAIRPSRPVLHEGVPVIMDTHSHGCFLPQAFDEESVKKAGFVEISEKRPARL